MLRQIQTLIGRHTASVQVTERERLVSEVMEARKQLTASRAQYERFMDGAPVWAGKAFDNGMNREYYEFKAAEDRYMALIREAKQAGVTATWEDTILCG